MSRDEPHVGKSLLPSYKGVNLAVFYYIGSTAVQSETGL